MKHHHKLLSVLLLTWQLTVTIATSAASQSRQAASIDLSWNTISASGGHAASTSYSLEATLGQPIVGLSTNATTHLSAGFWQTENTGGYRVFLSIVFR